MGEVIPNTFDWEGSFESTCDPLVEGLDQENFSTTRAKIRENGATLS